MHAESIGPDPLTDVGQRLVSEEPMYLILNFGERDVGELCFRY
jgi:hypothetical protein